MSNNATLVRDILHAARIARLRIATAESCTGGGVAQALTAVAGASDVFECGFVTYSNRAKQELLGVSDKSLITHGAVSEEVAREMAEGALRRSHADIAVSITGIAGPGGSEFKPEGRVCFGLARDGEKVRSETVEFGAQGRETVQALACVRALGLLQSALTGGARVVV